jgi:SAM-dependent methyltransferase
MKYLDRFLQNWRYSAAEPFVTPGCDVLDIGGFDGSFLFRMHDRIRSGVCIDPLVQERRDGKIICMQSRITGSLPFPDAAFDLVTMFAVYEHLDRNRSVVTREIARVSRPGGKVILTVPSAAVDSIIKMLFSLRLIDGMTDSTNLIEEHHRYDPSETTTIFAENGLSLLRRTRFQFGLNNLFVFEKKR